MKEIGIRLKQERYRLHLTQDALAKLGRVTPNTQGKYERHLHMPNAHYLRSVHKAGIDVLFVLTGKRFVSNKLTPSEMGLIVNFRSIPKESQIAIQYLAGRMGDTVKAAGGN